MLCTKTKQTWYTDNKIRHNLHSSSRMYDERLADHLDVVDHLNVIVIYLHLTTAVALTFTLRQMTMWPRNNVESTSLTLIQRWYNVMWPVEYYFNGPPFGNEFKIGSYVVILPGFFFLFYFTSVFLLFTSVRQNIDFAQLITDLKIIPIFWIIFFV